MIDITGWLFIGAGVVFFLMGTLALIRFPDLFTRLHALTKADNLGLGMIAAGLALHSGSFTAAVKLLLIWLLVMIASASVSHLIARTAHKTESSREHNA
jgi:multicomponent Na+:H+ antiporter subunit G